MDILTETYRALTSKTAQRTLLKSVLLTTACTVLYAFAALAYILFYNAYLPDQVTVLPIHLQYGYGANPYGVSPLSNLKDHQAYDISVSLTLPRSPTNIDRGNFMLALYLLDKPGTAASPPPPPEHHPGPGTVATISPPPDPYSHLSSRRVLHASHRPALIPYTDPFVSLASRLLLLPFRLLFPSSSSSAASTVSLTVPLVERQSFPPASVPSTLFLEVQAGQSLRVAAASVTVTAQLSGLRRLMHGYRAASFLAGTAAFWLCEVVSMAVAWAVLSNVLSSSPSSQRRSEGRSGGKGGGGRLGEEEERTADKKDNKGIALGDMSDTERTFPTTSRAPPLKYESSGGGGGGVVKEENIGEAISMAELPVTAGGEADDEDDGPEGWRDSGIGTSYSDAGAGAGMVRRRASGKGR